MNVNVECSDHGRKTPKPIDHKGKIWVNEFPFLCVDVNKK